MQRFELPIETQKKQELQKRYGISSTDRVITFTGRLVNNKGVKELMLAFEKVAAKYNDAKLLIVGGQSFSNNVKDDYVIDLEFIASRIGNGVIFTGYVDYSEITSYLQLSTIVVVPSTSFEAFPLSILEAMAAGIPVVVSDAGGTLEVIDERSGIVVNRGEGLIDGLSTAIEDLCFDDEKLHKMSVAAKRRSKVFSDKTMYNRFVDLLK
ncbi:glycosyltransferase family 4 protein [Bacteroides thetaiotaomicron]|uniref:glycosyltransferase family 4 protein n=1 Tax=Bacteroidaceae TaxID=815 RepID=UPI0009423531|nr:glycosyltransferase family 4 protein [Bacteroides thetaiotaomicron]MCS3183348.1 glycosyltransferase family 4 protein [Bacteroides thetaiotaomicron]